MQKIIGDPEACRKAYFKERKRLEPQGVRMSVQSFVAGWNAAQINRGVVTKKLPTRCETMGVLCPCKKCRG